MLVSVLAQSVLKIDDVLKTHSKGVWNMQIQKEARIYSEIKEHELCVYVTIKQILILRKILK